MTVRKRLWKTAAGEERQAWIVDYSDQAGKRRMKTFRLKNESTSAARASSKLRTRYIAL
jgi:integrase